MNYQFYILLLTQFIVGLFDNSLILIVIALLQEQNYPSWWVPILKVVFTFSFVFFAPFVGHASDRWPKKIVMLFATLSKIFACCLLLLNFHPFISLMIVGLGAAFYSPAKYGLATEMVNLNQLVKANAWLEVSTVLSSILGFITGGFLVSDLLRQNQLSIWLSQQLGHSGSLNLSILILIIALSIACLLTSQLPKIKMNGIRSTNQFIQHLNEFVKSLRMLWSDESGRISLCITTLFWGVGSTMQLLILVWTQEQLGFNLSDASYFQVGGAIGMLIGASIAASFVRVNDAIKLTNLGYIIGSMMMIMSFVNNVWIAYLLLIVIGAICALLIVPFNALLQHRGKEILFSGQSIAVQNFCENSSVLLISVGYSSLLASGISLKSLLILFGILIMVSIFLIGLAKRKK